MGNVILRGHTLIVEKKLITETCCNCGMLFAMTSEFKNDRLKRRPNDYTFYCPRGHPQHYTGPSVARRLQQQLDEERSLRQRAEQSVAMWADDAREARASAEKERQRANGYKSHATRITKRAKAGVCPCCNRTFKQIADHMARQHPEFTPLKLESAPS